MAEDRKLKLWHPARFTHGHIHGSGDEEDGTKQYSVIILNNPLENKDLLVDVCSRGRHDV